MQNRPDGSGMANSLCVFCCFSSFCGSLQTSIVILFAIRTDSRPFRCDERQAVLSKKIRRLLYIYQKNPQDRSLVGFRQFKFNKYSFWLNIFLSDKAKNVDIASYGEAF